MWCFYLWQVAVSGLVVCSLPCSIASALSSSDVNVSEAAVAAVAVAASLRAERYGCVVAAGDGWDHWDCGKEGQEG